MAVVLTTNLRLLDTPGNVLLPAPIRPALSREPRVLALSAWLAAERGSSAAAP
jgi:hypothetical protein